MISAEERMAHIKAMTPEDVDAIERRMLIEMAERYGAHMEVMRQRRKDVAVKALQRAEKQLQDKPVRETEAGKENIA